MNVSIFLLFACKFDFYLQKHFAWFCFSIWNGWLSVSVRFLSNFHRFFFHSDCAHFCVDNGICNGLYLCIGDALILLAAAWVQLVHGRKHVYKRILLLLRFFFCSRVYTSTAVCMLRIFFFCRVTFKPVSCERDKLTPRNRWIRSAHRGVS